MPPASRAAFGPDALAGRRVRRRSWLPCSSARRGSSRGWPTLGRTGRGRGLFAGPLAIALAMPADEQLELIDAHPRIGAPPGSVSRTVVHRAGLRRSDEADAAAEAERARVAGGARRAERAYEARFGFRYVVFVAGRPRAAIVPLMEAALDADARRRRASPARRRGHRARAPGAQRAGAGARGRQGGGPMRLETHYGKAEVSTYRTSATALEGVPRHPGVGVHRPAEPPARGRDRRPGHRRRLHRGLHRGRQLEWSSPPTR